MSSTKKWNIMNRFTARSGGCGCGAKATDAVQPKPISKTTSSDQKPAVRRSSSAFVAIDRASNTFSLISGRSPQIRPKQNKHDRRSATRKIDDSLAVVKDSDDPYNDFRQSMIQMIVEKDIYSGKELRQLLHRFLELNSFHHHEVIVRAFMEICNGGAAAAAGLCFRK